MKRKRASIKGDAETKYVKILILDLGYGSCAHYKKYCTNFKYKTKKSHIINFTIVKPYSNE